MKMQPKRRALDKIYKRRDRYEIPEWQRGEVWDTPKKQQLIDSILRNWRLPKMYFVKTGEEQYEVVDGQQRLVAIYEFFANELAVLPSSVAEFGGPYYKDLKPKFSDAFDDFEIDYDEIEDAKVEQLKLFFGRLQQGMQLNSSEKLNAVHSKLGDFCRTLVKAHPFFTKSIAVANTRLAHFDIASKVATIEIEGIDSGLRLEDVTDVFKSHSSFVSTTQVGKRIKRALDFLALAFPKTEAALKSRTVVQSLVTLSARMILTGKSDGLERKFSEFVRHFMKALSAQIELGQNATDLDFIRFQKSINANVKAGPIIRQEILLRKAFAFDPVIAAAFDPSVLAESGVAGRARELADAIGDEVQRRNSIYSAAYGTDLFKATNKTVSALKNIGKPIKGYEDYKKLIESLYFLFRESVGKRLEGHLPESFVDVNLLRTDLQHDVDHGKKSNVKAKKKAIGKAFQKYGQIVSPEVLDPARFILVQVALLTKIDAELATLVPPDPATLGGLGSEV
ncbi:MAG: hypothetical protein JWQ07_3216 [Ramlibacter sp.]|nr:hypothetical protein [Ramlibacter sp.]